MQLHANAKLGPAGRLALVEMVASGATLRAAAAAFNVAPATAHRWWHRFDSAALPDIATGVWAVDRSSRPHRQPRLTSPQIEAEICAVRTATGWGPRLVAGATGYPHATVWKVLCRHGLSRPPRAQRGAPNRYEWPRPGDLLHMDVCSYPRFRRPGHRATSDRSQRDRHWMRPETRVGNDYAHAIVDDHSRLAYVELHDDERAATVTGFVERALAFFAAHSITAKRLMTDNAFTYIKNRSLRELLAAHDIRHLTTQPYRPRTNGKVERFHQTMGREWGHGRSYPSSAHRASLLGDWLDHYNHRRPHSALGNRPPISRVHNLPRQDS
jgi:transposase InsO family protein/transposase-like protein